MMEDTRIDSPSVLAPCDINIDETSVKWTVWVCLHDPISDNREAEVQAAFAKYFDPTFCVLEIDNTASHQDETAAASGTYSGGGETGPDFEIEVEEDPSWLAEFAAELGLEVRS